MHKYLVRGGIPTVGSVHVEVFAFDSVQAESIARAMFGGKFVVSSVVKIY